jgi:predicted NUDIX family NTP pyrophosphohydrolase
MVTHSAGIVLWRRGDDGNPEILLVHPGGPFWRGRNDHAWSIPKGEFDPAVENAQACARREFAEELGTAVRTAASAVPLGVVKASGKHIHPFLIRGDFDPSSLVSNTTEIEWPPRSGRRMTIPEVDSAAWIRLADAERLLHKGQAGIVALVRSEIGGSD